MEKIERLIFLLKDQYGIYQKLYKLAEEKTELIKGEDVEGLEESTQEEEKLIAQNERYEKKRIELIGETSISQLINEVDSKYKVQLEELQSDFKELLYKVAEINQLNNQLINNSLEINSISLNLLTKNNSQSTYGKKGYEDGKKQNSIINHKA